METKLHRYPRLALGVVTLLFAGIIYAWSILKAPLASEFGWTAAQLSLNFTLMMCFFCIGGLISGLLAKKLSMRVRMIAGAVLVAAGFIITSRLNSELLLLLYIAYGFMAGTGIGIVYNVVIAATNAWFPDKKGLSSGCLMMGFGFSTLILGSLAAKLINSSIGWRGTYLILGIVIGAVLLVAAFLVKAPDAKMKLPEGKKTTKTSAPAADYTAAEMIKRPSFYKLFIFFILLAAVGSTAISFAKDFFLELGAAEATATAVVGLLSICNGLGRLASGALFDGAGLRRTQLATSAVAIAGPGLALLALLISSPVLGIIGLCICGFSYGFSPTVSAAFASAFYGTKNFALNFSVINLVLIPASFMSTVAGSILTSTGSYTPVFIILTVCSTLGLLINLSIKKA